MAERAVLRGESADVFGLEYGQHLLIWSFRRLIGRHDGGALVAREFADACAGDAIEGLSVLRRLLTLLGQGVRRRLKIGNPGCALLTQDEQRLLALVSAAQLLDRVRLDAHLCWLVRPEHQQATAEALLALGAILERHGHCLPMADDESVQPPMVGCDSRIRSVR